MALRWTLCVSLAAVAAFNSRAAAPVDSPSESEVQTLLAGTDHTRYDAVFRKYCRIYFGPGWDWRVFKAQAMAESNLDPDAKSWVGARGLMQLMPTTYKEVQTSNPELGRIDDPRWNIAAGIFYDKKLFDAWSKMNSVQSRVSYVLGSYNAGRGTMLKAESATTEQGLDPQLWPNVEIVAPKVPKWRYRETLTYVRRIQAYYSALSVRNGFEGLLAPPSDAPVDIPAESNAAATTTQ